MEQLGIWGGGVNVFKAGTQILNRAQVQAAET
ncbi:hypothetical protein LINPERPRIM_LOCUS38053 [Linum perenne]